MANLSHISIFDTSLEHHLPNEIDSIPAASSSNFVDALVAPSNEAPSNLLQVAPAPTVSVYINMGISEQTGDVNFAEPITPTDPPLLPSHVDYPLPSITVQRHSHHHHPHQSQNRNRYPYVPYFERRSAFRRSRTPSGIEKIITTNFYRKSTFLAPSMPERLSSDYRQDRTTTSRIENSADYNENRKEEEEGNC
jgi:hypothetical protein